MKAITIPCPFCKGAACVPLADEYLATLRKLAAMGGERSGAEMGRAMKVKPTAMSNRLAGLERHGLVTSRVSGRRRLFKVKEAA